MEQQQPMRVLIVEDEVLVAIYLEDLLTDLGHTVAASVTKAAKATGIAEQVAADFAILDLNLAGIRSFPVAEVLRRRGIPFMFATGYGAAGLTDGFEGELVLEKPYGPREVRQAIDALRARHRI